jgi:hypothetical protein
VSLHPFSEGNIASARLDILRCVEGIEAAIRAGTPTCWVELGIALSRAKFALAALENALELDRMGAEMDVTTGTDGE